MKKLLIFLVVATLGSLTLTNCDREVDQINPADETINETPGLDWDSENEETSIAFRNAMLDLLGYNHPQMDDAIKAEFLAKFSADKTQEQMEVLRTVVRDQAAQKNNSTVATRTTLAGTLESGDTQMGDYYGNHMDQYNDYIFVGAPGKDGVGAVYVYKTVQGGIVEHQILTASDAEEGGFFGALLDAGTNWLAVTGNNGAYMFQLQGDSWVETQKIENPGPEMSFFGGSIATDGNRMIITLVDILAGESVLIYRRMGSTFVSEGAINGAPGFNGLGWDLDVAGSVIAVSEITTGPCFFCGQVNVYKRSGGVWAESQVLEPARPVFFFGRSVAIKGRRIVTNSLAGPAFIGGPALVEIFKSSGAAGYSTEYTYDYDGDFGNTKSGILQNNIALIGGGDFSDNALLFKRDNANGWYLEEIFQPESAQPDNEFGLSVALANDKAFIGAPASFNFVEEGFVTRGFINIYDVD